MAQRTLTAEDVQRFGEIPEYDINNVQLMLSRNERSYNDDERSRILTAKSIRSTFNGLIKQFGFTLFEDIDRLITSILDEPIPYVDPERDPREEVNLHTSIKRFWVLYLFIEHFPEDFNQCSIAINSDDALELLRDATERLREEHKAILDEGRRRLTVQERPLIVRWQTLRDAVQQYCDETKDTTSIEIAQNRFMALLYTCRPPRRCDYATLLLDLIVSGDAHSMLGDELTLPEDDESLEGENYVKQLNGNRLQIILNYFKTVAIRQKPFVVELTEEEIDAYRHLRFLLVNERPQKRTHLMRVQRVGKAVDNLTVRVQQCFRHVCGLSLSADVLRKIYFISNKDLMQDYDQGHLIAANMSTSANTAFNYYNLAITDEQLDANDGSITVADPSNLVLRRSARLSKEVYALQQELMRRTRGTLWDVPHTRTFVHDFLQSDMQLVVDDVQYVIREVFAETTPEQIHKIRRAVKQHDV